MTVLRPLLPRIVAACGLCLAVFAAGGAFAQAGGAVPLTADPMDEAFEAAQWAAQTATAAALAQAARRAEDGDPDLARLMQERQVLQDRIARAEARMATGGEDTEGAEDDLLARAGEVDALRNELSLVDAALDRGWPGVARQVRPRTLRIAEVQALLAPDEGLLFFFSGRLGTHVWAITRDRAAWHRAEVPRVTLADNIGAIRRTLDPASLTRAAAALDDAEEEAPRLAPFEGVLAWLLYSELLRPLEPVLEGVTHLYTVTDGPLSGLPLSVLVTDGDIAGVDFGDPEALRGLQWMFRRHALTTLPSVETLALMQARAPVATEGFIGIGDPVFGGALAAPGGGTFFAEGRADLDALRALAPLPGTGPELRRLARLFDGGQAQLILGSEAREPVVRAAPLGQARVLAFATHGLLGGEVRGLSEPALALTPPEQVSLADDGVLTASEIATLRLDAEWVILSACNTAGGDGTPDAEGLSGLARAFLFAGARTLMVSHWPVRDDAAAWLTTRTLEATGERRKAAALQAAMESILTDPRAPDLAHPAVWAPFVVVGDGGGA